MPIERGDLFHLPESGLRAFLRWLGDNGYPEPDLSAFTAPVLRRYLYAQSRRGSAPAPCAACFLP